MNNTLYDATAQAAYAAKQVGTLSSILSIAIPFLLCVIVMRWKPKTKWLYALKFSLWPAVFLSYILGGPLAQEIVGLNSRYARGLEETLLGYFGVAIVGCVIFYPIGLVLSRRLWRDGNPTITEGNRKSLTEEDE